MDRTVELVEARSGTKGTREWEGMADRLSTRLNRKLNQKPPKMMSWQCGAVVVSVSVILSCPVRFP
jgi:hypothetical protein